jgi:N-acetyl-alpha-D-glucosaminyl L-malate synthase BshA
MRVGITCYPTYGGSGIVATELGLELAHRGHEVHFITYANPIRLGFGPRIHYHEVEVSSYPLFQYPPYCLALASRMAEVATTYHLDLLHVHYAIPHSISALLARQMMEGVHRLPFITTLHGTDITLVGADRSYFPITKFSIEQSDGVTSISEDLREKTLEVFGVRNEIRVINNFVNCGLYKPAEQRSEGEKRLVHISNFRQVKRVNDCLYVLEQVRREVPAHLYMAGDGPERGPAERLAVELGIESHVTFLGKQDRIHKLLPDMHVLLLPSEMESFGLAALEAMACGVVPVATDVGGVPELVTDGVDGYLEPVGAIDRLAARASQLLTDASLHARMAAAARLTARTRFCTENLIPRYEQYYEQVLSAQ